MAGTRKKGEMSKTCIACGVLRNELNKLVEEGSLPQKPRYVASRMHMDPEGLDKIIKKAVRENGESVSFVYGDCCPSMLDLCEGEQVLRPWCSNCCELILGKERYFKYIREGAFFLLPEWALIWRDIFEQDLGLTPEVASELMDDRCVEKVIYLDTGLVPIPHKELEECGKFLGLEVEILPVGLEELRNSLVKAGIARNMNTEEHADS